MGEASGFLPASTSNADSRAAGLQGRIYATVVGMSRRIDLSDDGLYPIRLDTRPPRVFTVHGCVGCGTD